MRGLSKQLGIFTLALFVGVVLTVCSLATFAHNSESRLGISSIDCSSLCSSHAQPNTAGGVRDEKDTDDKEPTPPLLAWPQVPINLTALYMSFVTYFFYVNKRKVPLLIGLMRF